MILRKTGGKVAADLHYFLFKVKNNHAFMIAFSKYLTDPAPISGPAFINFNTLKPIAPIRGRRLLEALR